MMLLTIHDANLKKVAYIDNSKQSTLNYYGDKWIRNLETATSTFEFTVFKKAIKSDTTSQRTYNYLNERAFVSFKHKGKSYVFSVMTVEEDEQTIKCYCENLNLELINEYVGPYKAGQAMSFAEYCKAFDLLNWTYLTIGINEISDQKRTLEWEGQDTKLARLLSLATKFDAEIDFETELNYDSTIKEFRLNVYKENDDKHQGVGRVRSDMQLTYGKNLSTIKRKIDKTGIYNAIRPTGKGKAKDSKGEEIETVVTIDSLPAWSEKNEDGVLEYYQKGTLLYAPLSQQMFPSAFTSDTTQDQWIRKDMEVDSDDPNTIRSAGIRDLKKNAYPSITYEVTGFIDAEIGDTIKVNDNGFNPSLLIQARVIEQEISFTKPSGNKTTLGNFKALKNRLSDGIQASLDRLVEAAKPYMIKLSTSNGIIFKNQIGESIVTPTLYKGGKPVVAGVTWRWTIDGNVTAGMTYKVKGSSVKETLTLTVAAYIGNDEVALDELSFVNVVDGKLGTPGTPGRDGRTPYVHTAWANNATGTDGFSLDSSINKLYIGIYTDYEPSDSTDPKKYKWTLVKGDKGDQGAKGDKGKDGNGIDSVTNYYLLTNLSTGITRESQGWVTTPPTMTQDKPYLWNYRVERYTNGTEKVTDPALIGVRGQKGDSGAINLIGGFTQNTDSTAKLVKSGGGDPYVDWGENGRNIEWLSDGWARLTLVNDTGGTKRFDIAFPNPNPETSFIAKDQDYTFMFETRNDKSTMGDMFYYVKGPHAAFYGNTPGIMQTGTAVTRTVRRANPSGKTIEQCRYIIVINRNVPAGKTLDVEVRFSMYLGDYKGDYVPFRGGKDFRDDIEAIQVLTQEQLNALTEKNQILEAEMQAKASMEQFSDLEKAYNAFVKKNEQDSAQSEKDLIEAGRRIELLTTQFGGLSELKTFIDTYMKSSNEGLIIGKNDASSTIKVSSDRISMFSAGREVMYISQGVIHIDNGIFTASVRVGKFRTEQYQFNEDMNVIRYVG